MKSICQVFHVSHRTLFSGLSFLTPVDILIKNYRMEKISNYYLTDDIDHD